MAILILRNSKQEKSDRLEKKRGRSQIINVYLSPRQNSQWWRNLLKAARNSTHTSTSSVHRKVVEFFII
ncbi:hypothetical protein H6G41_06125 [Tolypothrix sp. FACHB-123]|uniref:hypothetical protein n=1 Tax=Tolypothrix sp. FACHB-123 TaxID=2692868 RepID=UPI001684F6E4|nr:hypothetical protein [Tolypothrix sp. FACHB-123]MBD2354205.1 hypothetical protein [Tolypothrix sp. FACHB-123]